jgi:hypothetical protein
MRSIGTHLIFAAGLSAVIAAWPAGASTPFFFSTGDPDGKIATETGQIFAGGINTETADDFVLDHPALLQSATFVGLFPTTAPLTDISQVEIEFYNVFPKDSGPPSGHVPTRVNSPADSEIAAATRDSAAGTLSFGAGVLNPVFTASNSVVFGIHPFPGQFTGGEGPVTGQELLITVDFTTPILLKKGHYFFRPAVNNVDEQFLWLSAPRPILPPGTPFLPDLQTWIRNDDLAPDWLRIGTDITGQGPFNAAFSLTGLTVPEPGTWSMMLTGFAGLGALCRSRRRTHPA